SQAFTLLGPSPLVVSSASTAYTSTGGVWGIAQPPYAQPGSLASVTLPFLFAGVQFSLPYTQGTHAYLAGDTPTSPLCVDGTWQLNLSGGAGSNVTASVYGSGCQPPVDLASLSLPTGTYGGQLVLTAPQGATGYGTDDVVLYGPLAAGRSACDCWPLASLLDTYQPIQLQISQASALAVGATAQLPVQVVSAPLPVDGIHAEASWDPTALDVQIGAPSGSGIGYGNRVPGHWGFLTQDNAYVHAAGAGQPVLQLTATCLQPGTWPLTLSGSWWHYEVIARSGYTSQISQPFSFTGHVACAAPPAGATSVPGGAQVNPADGTLSVSVTGSGLSAATQAVLLDASGNTAASALSVTPGVGGTSAAAHFPATPGGIYTLQVKDTSGNVLAGSAGVDVPPALPYFTVAEGDALPQVPGFHETHFWRVTNTGDVNGVAVLLFVFPAFVTPEPTLNQAALPAGSSLLEHDTTLSGVVGSWAEIVSVPVQAGQAVDVPLTVTLDPNAIFGAKAPLAAGDTLPVIVARLGMVTTAQAQSLGLLSGPATGYGQQLAATSNTNLVQALSGVAALTGGSAASYETFLQSAAPSLAAQLYSGGLLSTVADLNDSVQAGVVSLTHGSSAAPQGGR
ncbi:MAG TPA: hypothetical protein VNM16_00470, partial [Bacillota bacterium]|nr:hypothetical protein [Bacillota bacterium]